MIGEDVVEGDVLDDGGTVEDELDVVGAVKGGGVPEVEQGLLVLVHRDAWLAQLWVEKGPQVLGMGKVSSLSLGTKKPGKLGQGASSPVATAASESSPDNIIIITFKQVQMRRRCNVHTGKKLTKTRPSENGHLTQIMIWFTDNFH